ncbi:MAG: hypothetical protein WCJ02_15735, partial [bacterium]
MTLYLIVQRIPWGMVKKGGGDGLSITLALRVKRWTLSVNSNSKFKLLTLNFGNTAFPLDIGYSLS